MAQNGLCSQPAKLQRDALQTQKLSADTNQTQAEMVVKIPVKIKMPVR